MTEKQGEGNRRERQSKRRETGKVGYSVAKMVVYLGLQMYDIITYLIYDYYIFRSSYLSDCVYRRCMSTVVFVIPFSVTLLTFQEDVVTDDIFILDAYDNIFLWIGEDARPEEKTMAMDAAIVSYITSISWYILVYSTNVF